MRLLLIVSLLFLIGCTYYTPSDIKTKTSPAFETIAIGEWENAADCTLEALEERGIIGISYRPFIKKKLAQILITAPDIGTIAIIDYIQENKNIRKTLWRSPEALSFLMMNERITNWKDIIKIMENCN